MQEQVKSFGLFSFTELIWQDLYGKRFKNQRLHKDIAKYYMFLGVLKLVQNVLNISIKYNLENFYISWKVWALLKNFSSTGLLGS